MQSPGSPSHSGIASQSSHQMNQPSVKLPKLSLITCIYCQGPHTSNSCQIVSNITALKDILRKGGRCSYICPKKNHLYRDCNSKTESFKCRGSHHISIKFEKFANVQKGAQQEYLKHAIILDKDHHLTTLIIRECHKKVMHSGVQETLTELLSQYWLVRGRPFIRTQLGKCDTCRRFEGKPHQAEFRVNEAPPFTAPGIDFLCPLYVKTREENPKVWICLYTCCVVRALHLDVVPNLTSEGFMRSFRKFTARRGIPSTI